MYTLYDMCFFVWPLEPLDMVPILGAKKWKTRAQPCRPQAWQEHWTLICQHRRQPNFVRFKNLKQSDQSKAAVHLLSISFYPFYLQVGCKLVTTHRFIPGASWVPHDPPQNWGETGFVTCKDLWVHEPASCHCIANCLIRVPLKRDPLGAARTRAKIYQERL